jgi:hypothetical protein
MATKTSARPTAAAKHDEPPNEDVTGPSPDHDPEDVVEPAEPSDDVQLQIDGIHARIDAMEGKSTSQFEQLMAAIATKQAADQGDEDEAAEPAEDPTLTNLPQGTARFFHPTCSDFIIILKHKQFVTTGDGVHHQLPQVVMNFSNHICTTDDPEKIELARGYIEKKGPKSEFFEDAQAKPMSRVEVLEGARGAGRAQPKAYDPVAERQAALAARL